MGFSRPEYWRGLLCLPPEYLPDPGIKPASFVSPAGGFFTTSTTWEAPMHTILTCNNRTLKSPQIPLFENA